MVDTFNFIKYNQPKTAHEQLSEAIIKQLKKEKETKSKVMKGDFFNFIQKTSIKNTRAANIEIENNLGELFEKNTLKYISLYGTKDVAALYDAQTDLLSGYEIENLQELTHKKIMHTPFPTPDKKAMEYIQARDQITQIIETIDSQTKIKQLNILDGYTADILLTPYNVCFDGKLPLYLPIDNVLGAQNTLDNHGLDFKDLVKFTTAGKTTGEANSIILRAYEFSPDYTNEVMNKFNITRDTRLKDGEDGFIRDTSKNNEVAIEIDEEMIKQIATRAVTKEIQRLTDVKETNKFERYTIVEKDGQKRIQINSTLLSGSETDLKEQLEPTLIGKSLAQLNPQTIRFIAFPTPIESVEPKNKLEILEGYVSTFQNSEQRELQKLHFLPIGKKADDYLLISDKNRPLIAPNLKELNHLITTQKDLSDLTLYKETQGYLSLLVNMKQNTPSAVHPFKRALLEIASTAYPYEPFSQDHATQLEYDLRASTIERILPKEPIYPETKNKKQLKQDLDKIKRKNDKQIHQIITQKIDPFRFENHTVHHLRGKELFTVMPHQEPDKPQRFAIISVKLDETTNQNQLIVTDTRFATDTNKLPPISATKKLVTTTKQDAVEIIQAHYKVAALDPRFIEPLYEPKSTMYKKGFEDKTLPKSFYSLAYEPVRIRTKKQHSLQELLKTNENIQIKKSKKQDGPSL